MNGEFVIGFAHVTKTYGTRTALDDVSFTVRRGECVVLAGPSGAGKTTLLRLIMMEELPTRGTVTVGEFTSARISGRRLPALRRRLGVLYQDFRLLRDRSVAENVALALRVTGDHSDFVIARRVQDALEAVGLASRGRARPGELSGGEQQRAALARALVAFPDVVLADEPTGNLDADTGAGILDILTALPARGTGVILATHDVALAGRLGVRGLTIEKGRMPCV